MDLRMVIGKKVLFVCLILSTSFQSSMYGSSKSKKAIVIGASSGMGREVAKCLSQW